MTQARKFNAPHREPVRLPRARAEPGIHRHVVRLEDDHTVAARAIVLATGADYRRLRSTILEEYEGYLSAFYAVGPPEAQRCGAMRVGVIGGGNSAAQAAVSARARRRARDAAAPPRRPARDDVRLPPARARTLRRRGARPKRGGRAARQRRRARGRHAARRRAPALLLPLPVPRSGTVHGLARRHGRAPTTRASSSPVPAPESKTCSRPACPASTRPATCDRVHRALRHRGGRRPAMVAALRARALLRVPV